MEDLLGSHGASARKDDRSKDSQRLARFGAAIRPALDLFAEAIGNLLAELSGAAD